MYGGFRGWDAGLGSKVSVSYADLNGKEKGKCRIFLRFEDWKFRAFKPKPYSLKPSNST